MKHLLPLFLLLSFISCRQSNSDYIKNIEILSTDVDAIKKKGLVTDVELMASPNVLVADSLIISYNIKPVENKFLTIYNLNTGKPLGNFCFNGRGPQEATSIMILRQIRRNDNSELVSDIYAYNDDKLLVWNITRSLQSGNDIYDSIIPIEWRNKYKTVCRFNFGINDDIKLLNIPTADRFSDKITPMHYSLYSLKENREIKKFPVLLKPVISNTSGFSTEMLSYTEDCIKPDFSKIAFGMTYAPVFGILDIKSGEIKTFLLDADFRFSDLTLGNNPLWCFKNLQADNDRIYALYHGDYEPRTGMAKGNAGESLVYVFDWDGNLLQKMILDQDVYCMSLDSERAVLYGVNPMKEQIFAYDLKVK